MTTSALPIRLDPAMRRALDAQSKIEQRPRNKIVADAIERYLRDGTDKERELNASLAALRAYRERDPGFTRAIDDFIDAEATLDDPLGVHDAQTTLRGILDAKPTQIRRASRRKKRR